MNPKALPVNECDKVFDGDGFAYYLAEDGHEGEIYLAIEETGFVKRVRDLKDAAVFLKESTARGILDRLQREPYTFAGGNNALTVRRCEYT